AGPAPTAQHLGAALAADPRYLWVNVSGNVQTPLLASTVPQPDPVIDQDQVAHVERSNPRRLGQYQIGQFDRESGRTLVRSHEADGAFRPVASPDGRWLVYAVRHDNREGLK